MIKTNELRKGNIINHFRNFILIESVFEDSVNVYAADMGGGAYIDGIDFKEIEPVPITVEWLERFGFWKMDMPFSGESGYGMASAGDFIGFVATDDNGWLIHNPHFSTTYYYVHQLQNLYFALIGEELALKELA